MIGVFCALDLFLFYLFWDILLIPMYFLIGIWGYDQRVYAALKFILYTLAGSVLMLVAIIGLSWMHHAATGEYSFDLMKLYALEIPFSTQVLVLPRLRAGVCDQGAAVPVPYLAARRARSGADGGLGDPGRRAAEDGRLRPHPLRLPAVSRSRRVLRPDDRLALGHRHRLRRARRDGPARHEEAGRLFLGQPHGLRRPGDRGVERPGHPGRVLPDAGPRREHGRAVRAGGHDVRPAPHAPDQRIRGHQVGDAEADGRVPDHHALVGRPAEHERLRRRVPDHARRLQVGPHVRRRGRPRRHPVSRLHAVDVPARVLRPAHQRPQQGPARSLVPGVGHRRSAGGDGHLHGRLPERVPQADGASGRAHRSTRPGPPARLRAIRR